MWPFDRRLKTPAPAPLIGRAEVEMLATYNSEVARGLVHHAEWDARMAELQNRFNEHLLSIGETRQPKVRAERRPATTEGIRNGESSDQF